MNIYFGASVYGRLATPFEDDCQRFHGIRDMAAEAVGALLKRHKQAESTRSTRRAPPAMNAMMF